MVLAGKAVLLWDSLLCFIRLPSAESFCLEDGFGPRNCRLLMRLLRLLAQFTWGVSLVRSHSL